MNLPFFIARRYFFSRKIPNVIHLISFISLIGVTVGSFALIVVLSVFNGFEDVVLSLYNSFDSDLKLTPKKGKYFEPTKAYFQDSTTDKKETAVLKKVKSWNGVADCSFVIEENVLIRYENRQSIATIKAIRPSYLPSMGVDTMLYSGKANLTAGQSPRTIVGAGIAGKLSLNLYDQNSSLEVFTPKKGGLGFRLDPREAFRSKRIQPSGIFSIQKEFDEKYIITPLDFTRKLINRGNQVTGLEVNARSEQDMEALKTKLINHFGKGYQVKNRYEQHRYLYQVMQTEKTAVYLILVFILVIAAFNLIGALLMLAFEKKKDMAVLKSMGATGQTIKNVFFYEGLLLSMGGAFTGITLGTLLCWLQMKFELLTLKANSTFVLDAYPVSFEWFDFVAVFATVVVLGFIASYYPARIAYKQISVSELEQ